jgi:hypothetical protein
MAGTMTDTITIGTWLHGSRQWKRTGERPHVTRDGRTIILVEWTSDCVICGGPFVITAAAGAVTVAKCRNLKRTTCDRHRMTNAQSSPLRYAPRRQRRVLFAKLKAEMLEADKAKPNVTA